MKLFYLMLFISTILSKYNNFDTISQALNLTSIFKR
nr:MAG TPA: hypothetical protein [Bacteriophage sp.]